MNTRMRPLFLLGVFVTLSFVQTSQAFVHSFQSSCSLSNSKLNGLLDAAKSLFLNEREGDFIKLEETGDGEGTGVPVLFVYNVARTIDNLELHDMLSDGSPIAHQRGIRLARLYDDEESQILMDQTLREAMESVEGTTTMPVEDIPTNMQSVSMTAKGCPVLLFANFQNKEMLSSYDIISNEIFQEDGSMAACAKCVENALDKPLGQVLEEISGDHAEALKLAKKKG